MTPAGFQVELSAQEFDLFRNLIFRETGIALKDSKRTLVVARLGRRLRDLGLSSYSDYYRFLEARDPRGEERRRLVNCITTNKTSFFRDHEHFEVLFRQVRAWRREGRRKLRIWCAASSTGEEPYSIAITLQEALASPGPACEARILASDIDTDVLSRAAAGVYPADSIESFDLAMKRKYFLRGRGPQSAEVQVKPLLKKMVTFQRINLTTPDWPVRESLDAIFCRNVMIYFDTPTRQEILTRMTRCLAPHGLLFVGSSETICGFSGSLEPVSHSVYRHAEASE